MAHIWHLKMSGWPVKGPRQLRRARVFAPCVGSAESKGHGYTNAQASANRRMTHPNSGFIGSAMKLSHESGRVGVGKLFNRESQLRNASCKVDS
jgi:hypothetical protein